MTENKLWSKEFILTSSVHFVLYLAMYLLIVMMASYTIDVYDASASLAGMVSSIFIIGVLFGRLYGGNKVEKIGKRKMLFIGNLIFIVMALLYFVPNHIVMLILIRFVQGIGTGLATTATATIVSQIIPNSRKGEGIGYFSISVILSAAIGPLIGVYLISEYSYNSIFIFSLVVGTISNFLTYFIKEPSIDVVISHKNQTKQKFRLSDYFEKNAIPISITILVVAFAYSGLLSFITTYSEEIQLYEAGGYYFLVYAIVIIFTRPFTGKLTDLKGTNSVVYPTLFLFAIGMLVISQANSSLTLLLGAAFVGLGYGNFQSSAQAIVVKLTPIERMGLANSTYFVFLDISLGLGPLIIGLFISLIGFRNIYLMLTLVIFLSVLVYHFVHGRRDKEVMMLAKEEKYDKIYQ